MATIRNLNRPIYIWEVHDHDKVFLGSFPMPKKPNVNDPQSGGVIGQVYQKDAFTFKIYLQEPRKVK